LQKRTIILRSLLTDYIPEEQQIPEQRESWRSAFHRERQRARNWSRYLAIFGAFSAAAAVLQCVIRQQAYLMIFECI